MKYYAILNIGSTLAVIIAVSVLQDNKNDPKTVFVDVVNSTGWSNDGFAFLFGFLRSGSLLQNLISVYRG